MKEKTPDHFVHIFIAVMGMTGSGKSSFIQTMTQVEDVGIGHSLHAETKQVQGFWFQLDSYIVHLIDTPGFDDTLKSDAATLDEIASWLAKTYQGDIKLTGILYLHRIVDNRMGGTALLNLKMFKKMCGKECLPNVVLMTTFWEPKAGNKLTRKEQEAREAQLIEESHFWGRLIRFGARTRRYDRSRECGLDVIRQMVKRPKIVLAIQRQIVDDKLQLNQTAAGKSLKRGLAKSEQKFAAELQEVTDAFAQEARESDERWRRELARSKADLESRIAEISYERQILDRDMQAHLARYQRLLEKLSVDASNRTKLVGGIAMGVLTIGLGLFGGAAVAGGATLAGGAALAGSVVTSGTAAQIAGELGRRVIQLATQSALQYGPAMIAAATESITKR